MPAPRVQLRPEHVHSQQGKDYVLYHGLLHNAHEQGLIETAVHLVQAPAEGNKWTAIVEATVTLVDSDGVKRVFGEIGDANAENTGTMVARHIVRMAATRAKARALRDALNIHMVAWDELDEEGKATGGSARPSDKGKRSPARPAVQANAAPAVQAPAGGAVLGARPAPGQAPPGQKTGHTAEELTRPASPALYDRYVEWCAAADRAGVSHKHLPKGATLGDLLKQVEAFKGAGVPAPAARHQAA